MIKLSDYILQRLAKTNHVKKIFMITGGGAMHLNDSVGRCSGIEYICNHHEQASAIAAEGYARVSGEIGVVQVTTGPGGFNTLTGILGQWTDSIPVLYISGQVKYTTTTHSCPELKLRQLGDQEGNIIDVVKPVTKYATMLTDPKEVKYVLDKAMYLATHGRPGPVWIDIPLDIQATLIDENELKEFNSAEVELRIDEEKIENQIHHLVEKLKSAKRPVIYAGQGIRLSRSISQFLSFAEIAKIPVVTAISGHDLIEDNHPLFFGKPGLCGDRIGNIMVQNADLLIILGTRLGIRQIGYAYEQFAPRAYKVMIDIDEAEMSKPTLSIDLKVHDDLYHFLNVLNQSMKKDSLPSYSHWIQWGNQLKTLLPDVLDDNPVSDQYVNSFIFGRKLFQQLKDGDVVCTGNGTAYTSTFQAMQVKKNMRIFANQGCASMGYDIPSAIGACIGNYKKQVVLVTGDGSIQMNLQELQTIRTYNLPIKIFVLENDGYLAIKTTQAAYFNRNFVGSNPSSGVICPDMERIASAYGIPFKRVQRNELLDCTIKEVLQSEGAFICEIVMDPEQTLFPKAASAMDENGKMVSMPLEKMFPFLPEDLQKQCAYPE